MAPSSVSRCLPGAAESPCHGCMQAGTACVPCTCCPSDRRDPNSICKGSKLRPRPAFHLARRAKNLNAIRRRPLRGQFRRLKVQVKLRVKVAAKEPTEVTWSGSSHCSMLCWANRPAFPAQPTTQALQLLDLGSLGITPLPADQVGLFPGFATVFLA